MARRLRIAPGRMQSAQTPSVIPYTYNGRDELLSESIDSNNDQTTESTINYDYDPNGSQISKTDSSGTTTYTWDLRNRIANRLLSPPPVLRGRVRVGAAPSADRCAPSATVSTEP